MSYEASSEQVDQLMAIIAERLRPYRLNDGVKTPLMALLHQYSFELLVRCINASETYYLKRDASGKPTPDSALEFLNKIGEIACTKSAGPVEHAVDRLMTAGKETYSYWNLRKAQDIVHRYVDALRSHGWTDDRIRDHLTDDCRRIISASRNWTQWMAAMAAQTQALDGGAEVEE